MEVKRVSNDKNCKTRGHARRDFTTLVNRLFALSHRLFLFYPLSNAELGEERTKKYNWVRTFTDGTYYPFCYGYEPV